jgi:hypothetical protein
MNDAKPILHTIHTGGSGTGLSYYSRWAYGCPRKATLDTRAEENSTSTDINDGPFGIGHVFHAMCELHYQRGKSGIFDTTAVRFSNVVDERARHEGERLFRAYRVSRDPLYFGRVLHVEKALPEAGDSGQAAAICHAIGVTPFTLRLDLVTHANATVAAKLSAECGEQIPSGVLLIDHKTDAWDVSSRDRFLHSHQAIAYMLAWDAAFPKQKCVGFVFDVITKTTKPEAHLVYVRPPTSMDVGVLQKYLEYCTTIMRHETLRNACNSTSTNCFPKGRSCPWFTEGVCPRY